VDSREGLRRRVLEAADGVDARVVHPDVDAAEALDRGLRQRLHRSFVGNVRRNGQSVRPALAGGLLERLLPAGGEDNARAAARELERRRAADAARGAGDDGDLAFEVHPPRSVRPLAA